MMHILRHSNEMRAHFINKLCNSTSQPLAPLALLLLHFAALAGARRQGWVICMPYAYTRIYARIRMFPTYALHTRMYKGDRSDRLDPWLAFSTDRHIRHVTPQVKMTWEPGSRTTPLLTLIVLLALILARALLVVLQRIAFLPR